MVTIETIITCDGGGDECEGTFADGDSRNESAKQQRGDFPAHGWHYYKGKDYCPRCFWRLDRKTGSVNSEQIKY